MGHTEIEMSELPSLGAHNLVLRLKYPEETLKLDILWYLDSVHVLHYRL